MLTLKDARVLDVGAGEFDDPASVVIDDGRVVDITRRAPSSVKNVVDLRGAWLLPGLIDCHVHLVAHTADLGLVRHSSPTYLGIRAAARAATSVRLGFTRLRDVGGADFGIAAACAESHFPTSHVHAGGPALSQTGGHGDMRAPHEVGEHTASWGISRTVDGVESLRQVTREQIRQGAEHIKLMLSGGVASPSDPLEALQYSDEEVAVVVAESLAAGRYVAGHCYTSEAINRGIRLGVRTIEHGNFADDETLGVVRDAEAFLVPTLATYWYLAREGREHGLPAASIAKVDGLFEAGLDALDRACRQGVSVAFGSDLLGDLHDHQAAEFALRAQVQPVIETIRSATSVAAALLGLDDVGLVAPGYLADLVAYDENPLEGGILSEPSSHLELVVKAGQVIYQRT